MPSCSLRERIFEPVWSSNEELPIAHEMFPKKYSSMRNGKMCYRFVERVLPGHLAVHLKPTDYFSEQGVKYLLPTAGELLVDLLNQRLRDNERMQKNFPMHGMPLSTGGFKIIQLKGTLRYLEEKLKNADMLEKMTHEEIQADKNKIEKTGRLIDLLEKEETIFNTTAMNSIVPGVGYF